VINIRLNGDDHQLPVAATLADAVREVTAAGSGIAVALDGDVVPRSAWPTTGLHPGARVEVLTAVQGG
jgi:sulfur carrier protein